jgi:sugar phosphate isomerase/epimerase
MLPRPWSPRVDPLLARTGVALCWEDFAGRRRFLSGVENIAFEEILAAITESGFTGLLTLECLPQFHDRLVADALWAQTAFSTR